MKKILLVLLVPVLWAGAMFANPAYEGRKIVRIGLQGNVNTDSALIRAQLSSKEEGLYSAATISRDVKDLFFLGYFSDIRVDAKRSGAGVELTFIFEEYEKVEDVVIKGADELSESDIKELLTIKKDSVYNEPILERNIAAIIAKYKEKGFINAKVEHEVRVNPQTRKALVTLKIDEGRKIVIEKITIVGAVQLEAGSVKGAMEDTHESGLFRSGIYEEANFEKDKERIVNYYHDRGFINMEIAKVDLQVRRIRPDNPKEAIFLFIHVNEGKRYRMGTYTFSGNEVFSDEEIKKTFFRLKSGEFFNRSQYQKDLAELWQGYRQKGYIFANIVPLRTIDEEKQLVNVEYKIFESEKAHIESIKIKGNESTKDYVIDREIRVKEGEIFNSDKIRRSQERLFNLRYFKDVNIEIEPGSTEGLMNLIFSVKEDRTGLFTLGAGYGTVTGFTFYEQISENNLFGRGLSISQRFEFGEKRKSIMIGIDTPYFFTYNPTSVGFSISYNIGKLVNIDTNYLDVAASETKRGDDEEFWFNRKSFEIQLRAGRRISEYWQLYSSYTFAWLTSYDENFVVATPEQAAGKSPAVQEAIEQLRDALTGGYTTKSSLRLGLIYDTRDYVAGPSRGFYLSQFFTYTGGLIGGNSQYILSDSNFSFFVPLMWDFVFAFDFNIEFLFDQLDGASKIYPGDELKFDGMTELRGWRNYSDGGRSKVSTLLEIRYPIDKRIFWGVLFYDTGKVWPEYDQVGFDLTEYKHSFGFGFRLQLSVLPIRLYFAKRFDYDQDGKFRWLGGADKGFFYGWETVFSVAGIF